MNSVNLLITSRLLDKFIDNFFLLKLIHQIACCKIIMVYVIQGLVQIKSGYNHTKLACTKTEKGGIKFCFHMRYLSVSLRVKTDTSTQFESSV